jgi:[acyl-carrier-protein] S-malonyltransferase
MQSAAQRLGEMLERTPFSLPTVPVYANVTAQPHQDPASIKKLLISQLVQSVRWEQTMQTLASEAEAKFIELAPGRVLSGLLKKINRRLPIENWAAAQAFTPAESRG